MSGLSITARMLIVALAPAVLVACLLSVWFLLDRVQDVERAEMARARTLAEGLALASEFGVATANASLLADIARPTLAIPSIVAVRFDGADGETLQLSGAQVTASRTVDGLDGHWWRLLVDPVRLRVIEQPVLRTDLSVFDDPLFTGAEERHGASTPGTAAAYDLAGRRLGTLHLTVDLSPAYHRQVDASGRSVLVTALVLLLTAPAAIWLARGVSCPIREVTRSVDRLARHDYFDRVPVRSGGELGELARGVLHLSAELDAFHTRLQESARVATDDLNGALDALERRNRELDEARAAAERASAFKSEFLANMSHEIRTPMNTVIGLLSTLTCTPLTADQSEQVALINRASESLLALIDDILDITRIETGNLRIEHVPCELEEMLEDIAHGVADRAVARGIELCIAPLPPEAPRVVMGDPLRLRQVLLNLLSNAIKFTPNGHVLLELSAERFAGGACTLHASVSDTGIGIAEQVQGRLFGAFAQADMSTTRLYGGAGLGLHICKGIVTLMGGEISLESAPGKGSRFDVALPLTALAPMPTASDARPPSHLPVRYVELYPALEAMNRRALALAGVPARTDDPAAVVLVGVPNRLLCRTDAGATSELPPSEPGRRRLALVTRITPDIRRWLRRAGFDGFVLRTPSGERLRRYLELALQDNPAMSLAPPAAPDDAVPVVRGDPDERARPGAVRAPGSPGRIDGASVHTHVLAIDDQQMNLDLLARYFEHLGVEGRFVRSDGQVRRELAARRFDLILLDLHMPERDGFEIAAALRRSDSPNRRTPLVALTADAYADSRARALACGFDAVLTKPVTVEQVRAEIERRLPSRRLDPGGAPRAGGPPDGARALPTEDAGTGEAIVSIAACAAHMLGNVEWATGAVATYRDEIPDHVVALDAAIARHDARGLFQAAHALKGVSDICHATPVADAARALERVIESDDWTAIGTRRDELVALLERAAAQCERELASPPPYAPSTPGSQSETAGT